MTALRAEVLWYEGAEDRFYVACNAAALRAYLCYDSFLIQFSQKHVYLQGLFRPLVQGAVFI